MALLSHHAYLIPKARGVTSVADFLLTHGIIVPNEARIVEYSFVTLGIDDARDISLEQLMKTGEDSATIFFIETRFITREAQNALLKTLEEPSSRTHFILTTPHPELLLATLRSRLAFVNPSVSEREDQVKHFIAADTAARLEMVNPMLPDTKNDIPADRSAAEILLRSLTAELNERARSGNTKMVKLTGQLDQLHGYITDSSSSVKLILEYVVFTVPSS
jgi:DNA polymerase III subunit delta'